MQTIDMIYLWLGIVLHCSSSVFSSTISPRNLLQLSNMINYKGYSAWDYNGYGCWCGVGNYGLLIVDQTDDCCRIHDQCYRRISGGWFGCSPKLVIYSWDGRSNQTIECRDSMGTCDRNACECDKAAADCFENHRSSYQSSFLIKTSSELYRICNP